MTNLKCEYNEEIGHYGQTLINSRKFNEIEVAFICPHGKPTIGQYLS